MNGSELDASVGLDAFPAASGKPRSRWLATRRARILAASVAAALVAVVTVTVTSERGAPLPVAKGFSLTRLGQPGQHVSLAAYDGRPVIVNFFASWCGPCQRETPLLAKFYAEHHGTIAVIGVDSNDQDAAAATFVASAGVSYPVGIDPFPAPTAVSYGIAALPQTFLLNARHQIVRHISGAVTQSQLSAWAAQLAGEG